MTIKPSPEFRWTQNRSFLEQSLKDSRDIRRQRVFDIILTLALGVAIIVGIIGVLAI